ncbi:sensor histidine kinase [Demequina rhizosphaerae]|uniref:sensor histidine kinase n=1 Tax=Demequina rhizosphaerae TaxID=1638985 RepID=UPI000781373F|nr:sensor histidine kinase [Demequina rhizosphaerae]
MDLIRGYLAATWEARTWSAVLYLLLGLPVSIALFVYAVTGYALGIGLAVVWVGVIILVAVQASMRPLGSWERGMANGLLQAEVRAPAPLRVPPHAGRVRRALAPFHDQSSWRTFAWIVVRIVLGPVGFALAVVAAVVPVSLLAAVAWSVLHLVGVIDVADYGTDPAAADVVDTVAFWVAMGTPLIVLVVPMPAWIVRGTAELHRILARWALGPCDREIAEAATARAELAEEQVRIDQELHDSIGHMITMNIVQAGAGAHVFDSDPEFARQALRNIEERGRAAMGELDRIIATLRGDDHVERAPLPGLDDVPALIDASRDAGIAVDAEVDTSPVPPAIGRAAFGIVREALTNAARHAPGAPVTVRVVREDDALGIDVANGPARAAGVRTSPAVASSPRPSRGVAGMRDRVTLLGGRTAIGPTADGGYRVRALLPLAAQVSPATSGSAWDDLREEVRA